MAAHPLVARLAQARHDKGLSLRHVAGLLGRSHSTVGQWETGARTPHLTDLEAWADVLGLNLALVLKTPHHLERTTAA